MSDVDVQQAKIKELLRDTVMTMTDQRKRGDNPAFPKFEDIFGKLFRGLKSDPRLTPKDLEDLKSFAGVEYGKLAKAEGFSGTFPGNPEMIRGTPVYLFLKVLDGEVIGTDVYADERYAMGVANDFLAAYGGPTMQEVNKWMENRNGPYPLADKKTEGTRVIRVIVQ